MMEPPVFKTMTDADLRQFIAMPVTPTAFFPKFSCHIQVVERVVKMIKEVSKVFCGQKSRDGFIRSQITSRQLMPKLETKRDYTYLLCNFKILNGRSEEVVQILSLKISFSGKMSVVHFCG